MYKLKSILVDVDAAAPPHPALYQAFDLAARYHARLTLADVVPHVPRSARRFLTPDLEHDLVAHRQQSLAAIAATRPDLPIETAVLRGTPAIAVIEEVLRARHDLVVRSHGRDLAGGHAFGSADMQLLRKCPCPVWLIGPEGVHDPPHVLAAVDVECDAPAAPALNARILDLALAIREAEGATVTVLHAWTVFGEELLRSRMSPPELQAVLDEAERKASAALAAFVRRFGERATGVHVQCLKGDPREVIPSFASGHAVDLVVMGTVARTGLSGFVTGNTAEMVLRQLRASVLAVKPAGFVTPVTLPAHVVRRAA